jgi:hypothetical protein
MYGIGFTMLSASCCTAATPPLSFNIRRFAAVRQHMRFRSPLHASRVA